MKHRIIEIGKDVLIGLLLCSLFILVVLALPETIVRSVSPLRWTAQKLGVLEADDDFIPRRTAVSAAGPIVISLNGSAGRTSFCADSAVLDTLYTQFSGMLGKALGTAEGETVLSEQELLAFAAGESLYFRYRGSIPVASVAEWLGAESCPLHGMTGGFLLTAENDRVRLAVLGEPCTVCDTQLSAELLRSELNTFTPDGSAFAFETEASPFAPLTVLPGGDLTVPAAEAENPYSQELLLAVAAALECNPYGAGAYTDVSGNAVFSEAGRTCTVSPDGRVVLTAADDSYAAFRASDASPEARTRTADSVLQSIFAACPGDARLVPESYTEDGENAELRFRYLLNGVPVFPCDAVVTFRGAQLASLTVTLRTYRLLTETCTLLPIAQAAAIAETGSSLCPGYIDSGAGRLAVGWTTR